MRHRLSKKVLFAAVLAFVLVVACTVVLLILPGASNRDAVDTAARGDAEDLRRRLASGWNPDIPVRSLEGVKVGEPRTAVRYALIEAVRSGEAESVKVLIERGADLNVQDEFGWTPLMTAARHSQVDCARLLLDEGADSTRRCRRDRTALDWALALGDSATALELMRSLVIEPDRKAELLASARATLRQSERSDGYQHIYRMILASIELLSRTNEAAPLTIDLDSLGAALAGTEWELHWLAGPFGNTEGLRAAIERGLDVDNAVEGGFLPLHAAVIADDAARVGLLLAAGASPDAVDSLGQSPLFMAAKKSTLEIAKALLDGGSDPNQPAEWGETPFHRAVCFSSPEFVQMLLEFGADPERKDASGNNALFAAQNRGDEQIIELLTRSSPE